MKKKLLLSILGLSIFGANAQTSTSKTELFSKHKSSRKSFSNLRTSDVGKESLDSVQTKIYDASAGVWKTIAVYHMKYDSKGNNISEKTYSIDGSERTLVTNLQTTFNPQNQIVEENSTFYEGGVWERDYKDEYSYDANGNLTLNITSIREVQGGAMVFKTKIESTYASGKLAEEVWYSYYNNAWLPSIRKQYIYDASGYNTSILTSNWYDNQWESVHSKSTLIYDNNGHLLANIDSTIIAFGSTQFIPYRKNESTWDAYGNETKIIESEWDEENNEWIPLLKTEFEFDISVTWDDLVVPNQISTDFKNKLTSIKYYIYDEDAWVLDEDETVYYNAFSPTTSTKDATLTQGMLYYDQTTQALIDASNNTPNNASVAIYNIEGKNQGTYVMDAQGISLQELNAGLYVYQYNHSGSINRGKFLVK